MIFDKPFHIAKDSSRRDSPKDKQQTIPWPFDYCRPQLLKKEIKDAISSICEHVAFCLGRSSREQEAQVFACPPSTHPHVESGTTTEERLQYYLFDPFSYFFLESFKWRDIGGVMCGGDSKGFVAGVERVL